MNDVGLLHPSPRPREARRDRPGSHRNIVALVPAGFTRGATAESLKRLVIPSEFLRPAATGREAAHSGLHRGREARIVRAALYVQ